jgi:DNA mismatch repair ATPase MutS
MHPMQFTKLHNSQQKTICINQGSKNNRVAKSQCTSGIKQYVEHWSTLLSVCSKTSMHHMTFFQEHSIYSIKMLKQTKKRAAKTLQHYPDTSRKNVLDHLTEWNQQKQPTTMYCDERAESWLEYLAPKRRWLHNGLVRQPYKFMHQHNFLGPE